MSEHANLSCDQDVLSLSLLSKQKIKEAELKLNASYGETDSVISSSTFISDSFYSNNGLIDPAAYDFPNRVVTKIRRYEKLSDLELSSFTDTSCLSTPPQLRLKMQPQLQTDEVCLSSKLKLPQKREVNWGDRSSIRLSVDYTKQPSKTSVSANSDKDEPNYFKICFATEFSDDEDVEGHEIEPIEVEEDVNSDLPESLPKHEQAFVPRFSRPADRFYQANVSVQNVNLLTAGTKKLLGAIPTIRGFFFREALERLLISQLQLILNDLLCQISDLNNELMRELPLRDELQIDNEERRTKFQELLLSLRSRKLHHVLDYKALRPTTLLPSHQPINAEYHFMNSLPIQYPKEKPQELSSLPTPTSPRIAKLKSYFFGFFNRKRSKDSSPIQRRSV
ncbi:hypothetical protein AAHC03_013707 [Spirometra sp. Aus1]